MQKYWYGAHGIRLKGKKEEAFMYAKSGVGKFSGVCGLASAEGTMEREQWDAR